MNSTSLATLPAASQAAALLWTLSTVDSAGRIGPRQLTGLHHRRQPADAAGIE